VATLLALGDGALAEGATARALAFYNRVLAIEPGNAAVVAKLARLSRRRRTRRALAWSGGALAVALLGAGVAALLPRQGPGAGATAGPTSTAAATPTSTPTSPSTEPATSTPTPTPASATPAAIPAGATPARLRPATPLAVHVRPYAQRALLDGVEIARGEQLVRFALAPGRPHVLQIEHACCVPFVRELTADDAQRAGGELRVPLEPRPARLRVDGDPATRVLVEGKLLGTAGASQRAPLAVPVPAGGETPYEAPARVTLEAPGAPRREVRVTLRAGAETIVPGPGAEEAP
jgi:serine/threonine-protein kinase